MSFSTPFHSIAKTVMLTKGEFDFDSIFNDANLLYSPMAYILFFFFVIVMATLFQNLLVKYCGTKCNCVNVSIFLIGVA